MSRYSGADLITNEATAMFPKMLHSKTINIAIRRSGIWYAVLGMAGKAKTMRQAGDGKPMFQAETFKGTLATEYEMKISATAPADQVVPNATDELRNWSSDYDDNLFATKKFQLTKFIKHIEVPMRHVDEVGGDRLKTQDIITDLIDITAEGIAQADCRRVWETNDQSRSSIAGIPYLIADDNDYVVDRSDPDNALYRSHVDLSAGAASLQALAKVNRIVADAGSSNMAFWACASSAFDWYQYLLENKVRVDAKEGWTGWGGSRISYDETTLIYDRYIERAGLGTGDMFRLDPSDFVVAGTPNINITPFKEAEHLVDAMVAKSKRTLGVFVKNPARHAHIRVTVPSGYVAS